MPRRPWYLHAGLILWGVVFASHAAAGVSSLEEAYLKGLAADPDFAAARASYTAETKSRGLAAAAFMPSVNLTASTDLSTYTRQNLGAGASPSFSFNPAALAIRLTQPVYDPARKAYQTENELRADRAQWVLEQARQDLLLRVSQTWLNYLLGQDQLLLAQAQAKALQLQLHQLTQMLASRSSTRTDVADAQARHELAVVQVRSVESQLEVRRLELLRLTGETAAAPSGTLSVAPALQAPAPADPQVWLEAARERNAKVMAQRYALQLAQTGVERAQAGRYPTLNLVMGRQRAVHPNYFTGREQTDNIGLQLSMNLYDGGTTRTQVEQALATTERVQQELLAAQHEATIAAGQAYWGVVNGMAQVRAMEQAVAAAELMLHGTRLGIQANVKTYVDELNATQTLFGARRDLQKERYTYLLSWVQLIAASNAGEDEVLRLLRSLNPG